jgi:UDP-glucose 4-epimerase
VAAEEEWPFEPHANLTYLHVDLTRPRRIRELLFGPARDHGVGTVVHTALHRRVTDEGRVVKALNVECTREMLLLAESHPTINRFVYRSYADVYRIAPEHPALIGEDHPLELGAGMPQGIRDRVEADVLVCTHMGMSPLHIVVLRCAEVLAANTGSQLHDYLESRVCFRPLGFDPMLNVMSVEDAVRALCLALTTEAEGVFNIPGLDVLPLSAAIRAWGRREIAIFGPLLGPLYGLRALARGLDFSYATNRYRFHFSGVLDGTRASEVLGYVPAHAIDWPRPRYVTHATIPG